MEGNFTTNMDADAVVGIIMDAVVVVGIDIDTVDVVFSLLVVSLDNIIVLVGRPIIVTAVEASVD